MEFKELNSFLKAFGQIRPEEAKVLLVSGLDIELGDVAIKHIQKKLEKEQGVYEYLIFSHESDEALRLQTEIANVPLFNSYRFLVVRQSEEVLKDLLGRSGGAKALENDIRRMPECTLLLLLYAGTPSRPLLRILKTHGHFLHLITGKLYGLQIENALRRALGQHKLKLSQEAFYLLLESVEAKAGSIEHAIDQIQCLNHGHKEIDSEDLRTILFPTQGWDAFALVDALFSGDLNGALREYKRFSASSDNFFMLLKLILRRMDEIRMADIAYKQHLSDSELMSNLGLSKRHPFIQKKILMRLRSEVPRFESPKQVQVYDLLVEMQKNFRTHVSMERHMLFFQQESLRIFF